MDKQHGLVQLELTAQDQITRLTAHVCSQDRRAVEVCESHKRLQHATVGLCQSTHVCVSRGNRLQAARDQQAIRMPGKGRSVREHIAHGLWVTGLPEQMSRVSMEHKPLFQETPVERRATVEV